MTAHQQDIESYGSLSDVLQQSESSEDADQSSDKYAVLKPLHRALLMMLDDFASVCERNGLKWCAHYGTAIGALREGGFIPWDEDIDLLMPRTHLDRAVALFQSGEWRNKYQVINAELDPNYPMATTRIMLRGTKCCDSALDSMDFDSGIFLDLFPLDDLADDDAAYKKQLRGAWVNNKLAMAKLVKNPYIAGTGLKSAILRTGTKIAHGVLNLPGVSLIDFNKRSLAACKRFQGQSTRRVGFACDTTPTMDVYERDDFEPLRWVPFEDTRIPLPNKVEKHLDELYGDWRTPIDASLRDEHFPDILELGPYADRFGARK